MSSEGASEEAMDASEGGMSSAAAAGGICGKAIARVRFTSLLAFP